MQPLIRMRLMMEGEKKMKKKKFQWKLTVMFI